MIHLDTHVVVWLYDAGASRMPRSVLEALKPSPLGYSPMVRLEIDYLHEIKRLSVPSEVILASLGATLGLAVDLTPFPVVAAHAARQSWTRDPFDRSIVGQALAASARLATADSRILGHFADAFWGSDDAPG